MARTYMGRGDSHIFWHANLTNTYMPPRKKTRAATREGKDGTDDGLETHKENVDLRRVDSGNLKKGAEEIVDSEPSAGDKRKKSITPEEANKLPKTEETEDTQLQATPIQILRYLLSDAALEVCRPDDELEDIRERGNDIITFSQLLTPFEELLCAVILSRPISHRLGLRTIRTILNAPYEFRSAVAIKTAGREKVQQALHDAHTQHQYKTAEEIELLAEIVSDNDWHNDLEKMRKLTKEAPESERELLRRSVKGLGETGLNIFYRRVQWQWEEAYPMMDSRTHGSLEKLGLPQRAEGIAKMLEVHWEELGYQDSDEYSDEEKRRRAFVVVLERAVSADLELKIDRVLEEASKL